MLVSICRLDDSTQTPVAHVLYRRGSVLVRSEDDEIAARLERFFVLPIPERSGSIVGWLAAWLRPGNVEHFRARCDRLYALRLRAASPEK